MKNWLLLSLGISSFGFSQISINATHMPVSGDTIRISVAVIDNNMDYHSTGPNYTWSFPDLEFNGQKLNDYHAVSEAGSLIQIVFGSFAAAKYQASFYVPSAGLPLNNLPAQLPITIEDINQFYKVVADSMTMVGTKMTINGQEIPAKSDTIETKYRFPLEYGNTYSSRGATDLDLNPIYNGIWRQHRLRETEVDGWGSISTPYGTFDALRIHHTIMETDSFYVAFGGFGTWIGIPVPESHEYEWRATEEKEPILLVKTSMAQGTETITGVEYRNVYTLGINEKELLVSMYPNPVQDVLTISSQELFTSYKVFTSDGKEVMNAQLSPANQQNIDVSALKKGTYLVHLQSENGVAVKPFVK